MNNSTLNAFVEGFLKVAVAADLNPETTAYLFGEAIKLANDPAEMAMMAQQGGEEPQGGAGGAYATDAATAPAPLSPEEEAMLNDLMSRQQMSQGGGQPQQGPPQGQPQQPQGPPMLG